MKKTTTLLLLILIFMGSALAQKKPIVYIAPFKYEGNDIRKLLPAFRMAVLNGVNNAHRVDLMDGSENRYNLDQADILNEARKVNADFILQCELLNNNLTDILNLAQVITDAVNNKSSMIYEHLVYNVKLTRVSDGILINTQKYKNMGNSMTSSSTSSTSSTLASTTANSLNSATDNALYWVSEQMMRHFEASFPLEAHIVEAAEVNKDKVLKVYIDLGSNASVREGLYFDVYEYKMIAGEKAKEFFGRVHVMSVKSENRSLCRVTKNPKGIKKALDSGLELYLVSTLR